MNSDRSCGTKDLPLLCPFSSINYSILYYGSYFLFGSIFDTNEQYDFEVISRIYLDFFALLGPLELFDTDVARVHVAGLETHFESRFCSGSYFYYEVIIFISNNY